MTDHGSHSTTSAPDANGGTRGDEAYPVTAFDDPHLQPLAKNPRRTELMVGVLLLIGVAGFAAYGGLYWVGGQTQWEGVFLGVGLFGFGFGMSAWGKYLLPRGPFVEDRHPFASTDIEVEAMTAAVVDRGTMVVRRRGFLGGLLAAGSGIMGVVLGFPLLRSLGPVPKKVLDGTNWTAGSYLVNINGHRIHKADIEVGGALTVFPERFVNDENAQAVDQTMLIRPQSTSWPAPPGREGWTPDGYVAYSKVCTHAGCPVGLYQEQLFQLLCPCHQSLFNVLQAGKQVFGPAPRPLPQLPLMIDSDGFLRSQSGYHEPIGPGFWERS
ncbi:MAG TPA: Rieske 2Fe-2S domain-containing protein [Acidimicrobiales bacterium]|nr:Rieske 2Fe-2S domain-containing protein [Acidimicrobiales bacterium]